MLDFLFNSQAHKYRDGFFLNHDNLMIATPEERKKLIFYYISQQVPEKLNPVDRSEIMRENKEQISLRAQAVGTLGAFYYAFTNGKRLVGTKVNKRFGLNALLGLSGAVLSYYIGVNVAYNVLEPSYIQNSEKIASLSSKYNFTVYDFAQAKKEAHLKALRRELTGDQLLTGY